jgi:hypothetical protein
MENTRNEPTYTVNGRIFKTDYQTANMYWQLRGGVLMEKVDGLPAHVLQMRPLELRAVNLAVEGN